MEILRNAIEYIESLEDLLQGAQHDGSGASGAGKFEIVGCAASCRSGDADYVVSVPISLTVRGTVRNFRSLYFAVTPTLMHAIGLCMLRTVAKILLIIYMVCFIDSCN